MGHIETAVAMYNASTVLHAYFRGYVTSSGDERTHRGSTLIPFVVICVFGIEVALKAMITGAGSDPKKIHDLLDLYAAIDPEARIEVEARIRASGSSVESIEGLLSAHRNSLQEWRYSGEHSRPGGIFVDPGNLLVTLRTILDVYADFYGAAPQGPQDTGSDPEDEAQMQKAIDEYVKNVLKSNGESAP